MRTALFPRVTHLALAILPACLGATTYTFPDKDAWSESFVVKNPSGQLTVEGGSMTFTAPTYGSSIVLMGTPDGLRPVTLADRTEADFSITGMGSLGFFLRGTDDAADAYLVLIKRTARADGGGYGEIQVYRSPIWPAPNLGSIQPIGVQKIPDLSDGWYRLKIAFAPAPQGLAMGVALMELHLKDGYWMPSEPVAVAIVGDQAEPLLQAGTIGLRLYVNSEQQQSVIRLRRLSLTPDPSF